MNVLRMFSKPVFYPCNMIILDYETKNMKMRIIFVCNKPGRNMEYEVNYTYIAALNILELDTRDISPRLDYLPRILELNYYYSETIQKTVYYFGYMIIPNKQSTIYSLETVVPIPDMKYTVEFLANKEHIINFV